MDLDDFYLQLNEPNQSCLLALRTIISASDSRLQETIKYGMPCFVIDKRAFCYLWADKITNEPYILMVDGQNLRHPKLERGDRKRMKILRINPNIDLDMKTIKEVLSEAIKLLPTPK